MSRRVKKPRVAKRYTSARFEIDHSMCRAVLSVKSIGCGNIDYANFGVGKAAQFGDPAPHNQTSKIRLGRKI